MTSATCCDGSGSPAVPSTSPSRIFSGAAKLFCFGARARATFPRWADGVRKLARSALPTSFPKSLPQNPGPMKNDQILSQISDFCRQADMAETTFGRRAVNDGKLVHRLREGKRITIDTLDRIQAYIAASTPGGLPPPRGLQVPPEKRDRSEERRV